MAIRYILAQFNQAQNKIILSPSELRVCPGDMVRWISRLDEGEIYVAGNFVGKTPLFTKDAYTMPGDGESELAELKADPSGSQAWTYTCSEGPLTTNADAADGQVQMRCRGHGSHPAQLSLPACPGIRADTRRVTIAMPAARPTCSAPRRPCANRCGRR